VGFDFSKMARTVACVAVCGLVALQAGAVAAQTASQRGLDRGQYIPNIWIDPDGCEHWVMDDGIEGFMTPHVTPNGLPVCREGTICGVAQSDQLFATDSFAISAEGQERLRAFFRKSEFNSFSVAGHTDSRATDAYNLRLSQNRANAVANLARAEGAQIKTVRGYGERVPIASNGSESGREKNRRVEILCVR
jgi:outer membrane protein OmpA-like peptidoglycan-associated protein